MDRDPAGGSDVPVDTAVVHCAFGYFGLGPVEDFAVLARLDGR